MYFNTSIKNQILNKTYNIHYKEYQILT